MKNKHKTLYRILTAIRIFIRLAIYLVLISAAVLCIDYMRRFLEASYHNSRHWDVTVSVDSFTESAGQLHNPDRGTYLIYGFYITDADVNYKSIVADKLKNDRSNTLAMIQINLGAYTKGEISETGLKHIEELFDAFRTVTDKRLLVRFLYDWDGKNLSTEPQSLNIILAHIAQLKPVLNSNSDQIFVMQGLFLGNWGEMNGSKYLDKNSFQKLTNALVSATDDSTFLSVRMPSQWRTVTELYDITPDALKAHPFAWRFSLYNDGIMGNEGDYGTYGTKSRAEAGDISLWNRAEELAFQEQLCLYVPNGGEVIVDNSFNDFENALPTLRQMHLTYFNEDYDKNVFNKWKQTTVSEASAYNGMDGYTYIKRHLGYRLVLDSAQMAYQTEDDSLALSVSLRNVGFAPLYGSKEGRLILHHAGSDTYYLYRFEEDVTALSRTGSAEESFSLQLQIPLTKLPAGEYTVCFQLWDNDTDSQLQLAVQTEQTACGYQLGTFTIAEDEPLPELPELPDLPFDLDSRIEGIFRPPFGEPSNRLWQWMDRLYPQR